MHQDQPAPHTPRPKFDTLFAEPRHYRGDCRMTVTAMKQGWLDNAPPEDLEALEARFQQAAAERMATDPNTQSVRAFFAESKVVLAMEDSTMEAIQQFFRYSWNGKPTSRSNGRPRRRRHVGDYPNRLDAYDIRRQAIEEGRDLQTLRSIDVSPKDKPDAPGERIALAVVEDARYGWRVWLVCPCCKCRRAHLYPVRAGFRCRKCAGIAYGGGGVHDHDEQTE